MRHGDHDGDAATRATVTGAATAPRAATGVAVEGIEYGFMGGERRGEWRGERQPALELHACEL